jgi:hypothetical protein
MKEEIKDVIRKIAPSFEMTNDSRYPLPNEVTLFLDNGIYFIELNLKYNVLEALVWEGEELIKVDADFVFDYLTELLNDQIELTQRYYDEESYEQQDNYYIK